MTFQKTWLVDYGLKSDDKSVNGHDHRDKRDDAVLMTHMMNAFLMMMIMVLHGDNNKSKPRTVMRSNTH